MDSVDFTQLVPLIMKGGPAAIILALFYGLAMLVREVRGGKVGAQREADLAGQVAGLKAELTTQTTALKAQVTALTEGMERMELELERALDLIHSMRYQRDQARIRVEFLEQVHGVEPRTVWPPEPQAPGHATPAAPPPLLDESLPPA